VQDRGLDFRNSFSGNPLCAPARSSLMTGQLSHNTGVLAVAPPHNFDRFDDRTTIGTSLQAAGYNTLFLGKYMNGYGVRTSLATGKSSFRYVPPGWTDWYGAVQRPAGSGFAEGGTYNYFHLLLNHDGTIEDNQKGVYQSVAEGRIARALVTRYHRSTKPFFLYFAPIAPHFGSPYEKGDPVGVVRPGAGTPEAFKTPARPAWVRGRFDHQVTRAPGLPATATKDLADIARLPRPMRWLPPIDAAEKKAMLAVTRQRAESLYVLDQQIGQLVARLKALGEYDDTVLVFTSDNGYFLGEHRMRLGKIWAHEPSLRVPFLVAGPGVPHGRRFDPISTEDVAATVLDLAGAAPPRLPDGASVVPSFGRDRGWRDPVVLENRIDSPVMTDAEKHRPAGFGNALTGTGVRTARWVYVRYVDGDAELYDLAHDPNELHNVYGEKTYAGVQAALARVWATTRSCAGPACHAPLPASLQASPSTVAGLTRHQEDAVHARFGTPTP
jgi:N-acetylglucosamine-6-sulfatase